MGIEITNMRGIVVIGTGNLVLMHGIARETGKAPAFSPVNGCGGGRKPVDITGLPTTSIEDADGGPVSHEPVAEAVQMSGRDKGESAGGAVP